MEEFRDLIPVRTIKSKAKVLGLKI